MTENPSHYSNVAREPHKGDVVRLIYPGGAYGSYQVVSTASLGRPDLYDLVQPWWDVDAKPGTKWKDCDGDVWTKRDNGLWSFVDLEGFGSAVKLEATYGPGELVTPEPAPIPESTAPTRPCIKCERMETHAVGLEGVVSRRNRTIEDLRATIAKRDERIKELEATSHGLTKEQREELQVSAAGFDDVGMTPFSEGLRAAFPEAFEPDPGVDIPDEVVEVACRASGVSNPDSVDFAHMRAAIAAADARRAELEEAAAAESSHTLAEVVELAWELVKNDRDTLRKLLERFNAPRVRELKPEQIDDFYAALAAAEAKRAGLDGGERA